MKYAYYGFGMLLFGAIGLVIIVMMQSVTINNDSEYYNLKEAMKASMIESIDTTCYRSAIDVRLNNGSCGSTKLKISEQKFVENFTRRFVATVGGDADKYTLKFYDIIESPPKASVVIEGLTKQYGIVSGNEPLTITNSLSGILEQDKILVLYGRKYKVVDVNSLSSIGSNEEIQKMYSSFVEKVDYDGIDLVENKKISTDSWSFESSDSGCKDNNCSVNPDEIEIIVDDSNVEE